MKLSVIIPFCYEISTINETVNSVLINSTLFPETEIILINDGLLKENEIRDCFKNNINKFVKVVKNNFCKGVSGARNAGLNESNGDIIAFLDADDCWLFGKLEAQMQEIKKGATFVTTSYRFDKSKVIINPPRTIYKPVDIFLKRGIGASTVIITKELLESHKFNEIKFAQDIDFWYKLALSKKFKYARVAKVLVEYNTGGLTSNKLVQLFYFNKVLSINKINILTRIKSIISYSFFGFYNHYIKKIFF